jgi:hypothetical protein
VAAGCAAVAMAACPGGADARDAKDGRKRGFRAAPEEGVARHRELRRFLQTFLGTPTASADGEAVEGRPEVRTRNPSAGYFGLLGAWEYLVGWPPDLGTDMAGNSSIFLEDAAGRFKRLLLAGRETDMVILQICTYLMFDLVSTNTYVAVFATYAMDVIVRTLRTELATRNIASKTLLDDRFLL